MPFLTPTLISRLLRHVEGTVTQFLTQATGAWDILNKSTLLTLYYTMFIPHVLYCIIVWGGANKIALDKLIKLQKRAVRLVSGSSFLAHTSPIFLSLNLLKLTDIYEKEVLTFMFKIGKNILPSNCDRLAELVVKSRYDLRVTCNFKQCCARTVIRQKSISVAGPSLWNRMPLAVRVSVSPAIFSREVIQYLMRTY
jgi:hypothetical protein